MARDLAVAVGQGDTPLSMDDRELLILSVVADTLDWVLGEQSQLENVLASIKGDLNDAGYEFVPRPEVN